MDLRRTLPAEGGRTQIGYWWGCGLGKRDPLPRTKVLMVWLDLQGRRRWGTPESSIKERDFLDLAPVDEGG